MKDSTAVYAQEYEDPVEAVFAPGGPFGLGRGTDVELRQDGGRLATVDLTGEGGLFGRELARIDFGGRVFTQTVPPDRTLGEFLAELFSRYRWRRVWRAGSGIVTEVRNITHDDRTALKAGFRRNGTSYVVERPIETGLVGRSEGAIRLLANHRELARFEDSMEDRRVKVITPNAPLRLDVIAIAFALGMALELPRGGGGTGAGGGGGGGGDGGGGC